ncbi:MAG: 2-oxo-4-hydroxy-4-carboxy-5-ureidoimidazoline decarboxylase [Roseiflexaceae bacterium]
MTLAAINTLDQEAFAIALGFLFEGSPWITVETWLARPFASLDQLHQALCATMERAPIERKIALIQAHPDLAGRAATAGELTPESTREQASASLNRLTPEEFATFTRLNQAYRDTFGFPFVICVREQTRASILASFADRLEHAREQEIATALGEIAKIARLRLLDAVRP